MIIVDLARENRLYLRELSEKYNTTTNELINKIIDRYREAKKEGDLV